MQVEHTCIVYLQLILQSGATSPKAIIVVLCSRYITHRAIGWNLDTRMQCICYVCYCRYAYFTFVSFTAYSGPNPYPLVRNYVFVSEVYFSGGK